MLRMILFRKQERKKNGKRKDEDINQTSVKFNNYNLIAST